MERPYSCRIKLAGIPFVVRLHFAEALACFLTFNEHVAETAFDYQDTDDVETAQDRTLAKEIKPIELSVTESDWATMKAQGFAFDAQNEASLITGRASDALLDFDRCIAHAVAVAYRGRAWLITGRPGVGKTTQLKGLQRLEPGAFTVICGDRPVLQLMEADSDKKAGDVLVHPSPWNGKENFYGTVTAPLAGIICLERGEENRLELLRTKEAVLPLFHALIQTGETTGTIRKAAAFEERLLQRTDVWQLTSFSAPESTELLYALIKDRR